MKKICLSLMALCFGTMLWAGVPTRSVAVYLQNLPSERIGSWTDAQITTDLQSKGFFVLPLDCSTLPQTSPELETALVEWCKTLPTLLPQYEGDSIKLSLDHIYYIPEGYTYDKVAVWNIVDHGADGSLEYIMKTYNKEIVPVYGKDSAFVYTDMVDKNGNQLDYNMYVDIIYPSGAATRQVPLLLNHASNSPRQKPFNPSSKEQVVYRLIFQLGFLTTGYAYANMDHCFNPVARNDVYKYFDNGYTLDDWNGLASNTACVRYLKSHLSQYNLNGKIGCMGISKASYGPMRLADPNNAKGKEHFLFDSKENTKTQPWLGASSAVDVVYSAAGNGSVRIPTYVNAGCVPMITSAGSSDEYNQWAKYPPVVSHMNKIDHNYVSFWMEDLGHTYPGMGIDLRTGEKRYVLFKRYFDRYLKPFEVDTTAIFYILPKEGATDVRTNGESRVMTGDGALPVAMLDVSPYEPITVRYLYAVDTTNLSSKIQIKDSINQNVSGSWKISMQGTCLSFYPDEELVLGGTYTIHADTIVRSFTVNSKKQEDDKSVYVRKFPVIEDAYTKVAKATTVNNTDKLDVRYSTSGDWRFDSYLKVALNLDSIPVDSLKSASLCLNATNSVSTAVLLDIYTCANTWSETTLVSANRPTIGTTMYDEVSFLTADTVVKFNVTAAMMETLQNRQDTISFVLRANSKGGTEHVYFKSKDIDNEALKPYLEVKIRKPDQPTAMNVVNREKQQTTKQIRDGQIFIVKDGMEYTLLGVQLNKQ